MTSVMDHSLHDQQCSVVSYNVITDIIYMQNSPISHAFNHLYKKIIATKITQIKTLSAKSIKTVFCKRFVERLLVWSVVAYFFLCIDIPPNCHAVLYIPRVPLVINCICFTRILHSMLRFNVEKCRRIVPG